MCTRYLGEKEVVRFVSLLHYDRFRELTRVLKVPFYCLGKGAEVPAGRGGVTEASAKPLRESTWRVASS